MIGFSDFLSFPFLSFPFLSFPFLSFPFLSFHFNSFHFISFQFISFQFISFHFILFHFIALLKHGSLFNLLRLLFKGAVLKKRSIYLITLFSFEFFVKTFKGKHLRYNQRKVVPKLITTKRYNLLSITMVSVKAT